LLRVRDVNTVHTRVWIHMVRTVGLFVANWTISITKPFSNQAEIGWLLHTYLLDSWAFCARRVSLHLLGCTRATWLHKYSTCPIVLNKCQGCRITGDLKILGGAPIDSSRNHQNKNLICFLICYKIMRKWVASSFDGSVWNDSYVEARCFYYLYIYFGNDWLGFDIVKVAT
jgi:hypothetical protein